MKFKRHGSIYILLHLVIHHKRPMFLGIKKELEIFSNFPLTYYTNNIILNIKSFIKKVAVYNNIITQDIKQCQPFLITFKKITERGD